MNESLPAKESPGRWLWRSTVLLAVVLAVIVGVLVFRLFRSSETPTAGAPPTPAVVQAAAPANPAVPSIPAHGAASEMGSEASGRVAALQARLLADPSDLAAGKELALILLRNNRLVEAFEVAEGVLAKAPEDPDGLYVQAVVRLAMGQSTTTLQLLDRVLAQYPNHVLAKMTRGKALMKMGNTDLAVSTWREALEDAGGRHPELERLLAEAGAMG